MDAIPDRVAHLEGAFGQMNKRLARIEAELLAVLGSMWLLIIAVLMRRLP